MFPSAIWERRGNHIAPQEWAASKRPIPHAKFTKNAALRHRTPGSEAATDVVLELFLGAPGRTPHLEYVLARFIATEPGVHSIVYCRKFPFTGNGDQNVNVDAAIKNSARWIRELQNVPVDSVRRCFLPADAAPAAGVPGRSAQPAP